MSNWREAVHEPVEIEQAISALAERPFDPVEFPFAFLQAFGNKETTLRRLRKGETNRSDFAGPWGGVLQRDHIHIAVAAPGEVTKTLGALKASPATRRAKAKFILATDGDTFEAEDLASGETVACAYRDFPDRFGFFLPLAGITTVRQIAENAFDIRATGRLNKLYVELLKDNREWGTAARRHDMNHFICRAGRTLLLAGGTPSTVSGCYGANRPPEEALGQLVQGAGAAAQTCHDAGLLHLGDGALHAR